MPRVCFLTGKRGGFDAMLPTLELMAEDPRFDLSVIVTDQHLMKEFGQTSHYVNKLLPKKAKLYLADSWQQGDSGCARARATGRCLENTARALERLRPEILLIIGDRGESLAGAIAAHNMGIAIAHVQGGDITGCLDDANRHAITKLAHLHFVTDGKAWLVLEQIGEHSGRIHVVGDPHVDALLRIELIPIDKLMKRYKLPVPPENFLLVLQHPDTFRPDDATEDMIQTARAVVSTGLRSLFIYPCSDQGYKGMVTLLNKLPEQYPQVTVHKNIPHKEFIGLLSMAGCLVGNSSAGVIEACYFGTPVVDIGTRQNGRRRPQNVIWCEEVVEAQIYAKTRQALSVGRIAPIQPWGDGTACRKIVEVLANLRVDRQLLSKGAG
ncbi:MAG: UDP-N-acetylglucosamine 2-epimerase [Geminicoccaceae bacterium]